MPRERAEVVAALSSKGFEPTDRDHLYFFFRHPNLIRAVFTYVSYGTGSREISDDLLAKMSKQLQLTRKQFDLLIDCPMQKPEYIAALEARGVLRKPKPGQ